MNMNDLMAAEPMITAPALYDTSAEAIALSMLMQHPQAVDEVGDSLVPELFTLDLHKAIFAEWRRQSASGKPCDGISVATALAGVHELVDVMDVARCHDHSARTIGRYVTRLSELHQARCLHAMSYKMSELAFDTAPIADRIDRAQAEVAKLMPRDAETDWVDAYTASMEHLATIEEREAGTLSGLATGFYDLDEMLDGGMVRGNLVVIGARPAMGKTSFAMSIGLHMARTYAVGMFSMEMPHSDVRDRQAAILGRLQISAIKRPKKGLDYSQVVTAVELSRTLRWNVSDRSNLNILQVRSMARSLKRRKGLDVLIVDYIGLMAGLDSKQSRAYQIEEISRGLKSLAKELDIVVVCLAQVNRGAAEKAMTPPSLHELRDSGAIEQDADVVAFIHRPIQANPDVGEQFANYAQLRVAKNRQGRTGDVHLYYRGEMTAFESWDGPPPVAKVAAQPAGRGFDRGM